MTARSGGASAALRPIPREVRVVAGENFWRSVSAQIGGRYVLVISVVTSPAADPHLFCNFDIANAMAVAEAGLVIENARAMTDSRG